MHIFRYIKSLIWALIFKVFPSLSYKGVVNTLVSCYRRIKRAKPDMTENEALNLLVSTRVQAPPRVATIQEELEHYQPLLQKNNKTLEEVIFAIVEYEYISSRKQELFGQLSAMRFSRDEISREIENQESQCLSYIRQCIAKI